MRNIEPAGATARYAPHLASHLAAHVAAAGRLMSAGRFEEADILVADVLAVAPEQVDALLLRATGAMARGALEPGFELMAALAGRHPGRADVIANLGAAHAALGRSEEAFICLEQAAQLAPDDGLRRAELAALLLARDEPVKARAEILAVQRLAEAADDVPLAAEGWSLAARLLIREGKAAMAEASLRRALELRPAHAPDLALLADLLAMMARAEEALAVAEQAYLAAPANPAYAVARAGCLMEVGRLGEAEAALRRVLAITPHDISAADALARVSILQGDAARGLAAFGQVVRRTEGAPGVLLAMARLLRLNGDLEKALAFTEQAVQQAPEAPEASQLCNHLRLALGRMAQVWPERDAAAPPLPDVTAVVIPAHLTAGEIVLLARFAGRRPADGGPMPCHCEPALLPLLQGMVGIRATAAPAPADAVALSALPGLLGVGPRDLARPPYLAVDAARHARWGAAMAHLPRPWIGLVPENGALGLQLAPLAAALAGHGTLISLAFDAARAQVSECPDVVDAGADMADARDLAAILSHLDLVAGHPGLALHMAGAMGAAAVALVPAALPWAFAHREGVALWYPSVRVLRQTRPGQWADPLRALAAIASRLTRRDAGPLGASIEEN
ncbi:tetratricopeptide repeat protein [Ancylobacter amanitiformis]|uniref:Tetratricopeptide (TPR) repeat protein n=1 Tax=Ancylobacter amanitiformis TaxID=217069 RepID=A0ABU0LL82_9HYPH|nr:tetratricopeptide repeat protein [Ancylobacter amanitiformis]MDQ0509464.1 tetratricopeptide (TPR) repeat protein [Ancylobacter amanitiformis]